MSETTRAVDYVQSVRRQVDASRFALISEKNSPTSGFDRTFRQHVIQEYFDGGKLIADPYESYPPDRLRARDVLRVTDHPEKGLLLAPGESVAIGDRSYQKGYREYPRIQVMQDPLFCEWVRDKVNLMLEPIDRWPYRSRQVTVGVNLFRTFKDVASGPHQDDEERVLVYVADKQATGATTELYRYKTPYILFRHTLEPGEGIIFEDGWVQHTATPLLPLESGVRPRRDAIVMTVNKPDTYPLGPFLEEDSYEYPNN
ncbi:MAG TPA: 2OG-Fe dioxygenase family protein [Candidatus Saccharimonadales bacterium]|nr:2OG-Fe dioxygenase family protein [Candidatus Saccharimonadales bacterium]